MDPGIADLEPEVPFDVDMDKFMLNLRTARKGCAGGPSGMKAEHLKVGLERPVICGLMGDVECKFARKDAGRSGSGDSSREDHSATEARWWSERHRCRGCLPPIDCTDHGSVEVEGG